MMAHEITNVPFICKKEQLIESKVFRIFIIQKGLKAETFLVYLNHAHSYLYHLIIGMREKYDELILDEKMSTIFLCLVFFQLYFIPIIEQPI